MLSGYFGGPVDRALVLLMDTVYSLPVVLLAVVMAFLLGQGLLNAAAALCVVYVPQYFRVVRNQTASVKAELFVEAAQSLGAGPVWIMRKYLFRNVITSVPVVLTMNAAAALSRPWPKRKAITTASKTTGREYTVSINSTRARSTGPPK